jgi:type I restriction-modification system DNA methylase subunit
VPVSFLLLPLPREQYFYAGSSEITKLIDTAARRAGLSRGQTFEDYLTCVRCALSGQQMEDEYLATVRKGYDKGAKGRRGIDALTAAFGRLVDLMEETRKDILGDVFQGGITYGEGGQFFTPETITSLMGRRVTADEESGEPKTIFDPCVGSGRFLLSVAEQHPHWEFHGQDIDFRCVQMTAINLGLRNLYGNVMWGNSLVGECNRVFRTGLHVDGGVIRELQPAAGPAVPEAAPADRPSVQPPTEPVTGDAPKRQQRLF